MQIQKGLVRVHLPENGGFHNVLGFTPLILRRSLQVPEEGVAALLVLHFQEPLAARRPRASPQPVRGRRGPCPPEPRPPGGNRSPKRDKCPQMHVHQGVDGGLHLGRIILTNLGARGVGWS